MKILLVSPGTEDEIDNKVIRSIPYLHARAFNAPHAVAAVAALTPTEHEVQIIDEYIKGPVENFLDGKYFDIIGISFTSNQLLRCLQIAKICKKTCPDSLIVAGGIGVEALIYKNNEDIDVVFHGEAEDTWPAFLNEYSAGRHRKVYKNITKPDMSKVPAPRWELIADDIKKYNSVSVQTTRGCPYDCSFCDVIYTYGRNPRSKTIGQVLNEIKKLKDLGVEMVFFADDNFTGNRKYAKELLRELAKLNNTFEIPMGFFTQLDITIATDDELLELLADCNFFNLMIGIESVNPESLKEMNKKQNIGISAKDAIQKIQSYGMAVLAHMIIGTDADNKDVFSNTADFITETGIVQHICHPLAAPPGTKMWYDFKRQGRLVSFSNDLTSDKMDIITNVIPMQMSRAELFNGLADYWDDIYSPEKYKGRAIKYIKGMKRKPKVKPPGLKTLWSYRKTIGGVFSYFLFKAGKKHRSLFFHLLRTAGSSISYLMPKVIFMYTFYLIDLKRSKYDSDIARQHALWESEHPESIVPDTTDVPLSDRIRSNAALLVETAYKYLRQKSASKELIYKSVLAGMMEFNNRFGHQLDTFDEFFVARLQECCERQYPQIATSLNEPPAEMSEKIPSGFTREIMDALDNSIRYQKVFST